MTTLLKLSVPLLLLGLNAFAQDAGSIAAQQAAQQATQQAEQANRDAMRDAQEANERAIRDAQQAQQNAATLNTEPAVSLTAAPSFSVKAGPVPAGTVVRLKSRTHYAAIYYTTDGWSPTTASKRYTGPITVTETTVIQAFAVAPNMVRSLLSTAKYVVQGAQKKLQPLALDDGVLHAGTALELVTDTTVNSKTAQVGDPLKLALAQDVLVGDRVVLPKGTPVDATITQADPAGHAGTPGDVAFEVHGLQLGDREIPLHGGATLEGTNHYKRAMGLIFVPVVGDAALLMHGEEAEITPGMALTAAVAADAPLVP
jgi:hypothetical protein